MLVISVIETENPNAVPIGTKFGFDLFGDPYGTRTHVTAVKGRCLNLLTNGPGSGNLTRTDDNTGMNRVLYQLSYAAVSMCRRNSKVIIIEELEFVKPFS